MYLPTLPARLRPVRPGRRGAAAAALTVVATLGVAATAYSAPAGHHTTLGDPRAPLSSSSSSGAAGPTGSAMPDSPPRPHRAPASSHAATSSPSHAPRHTAKPSSGAAGTGAANSASAGGAQAPAAVPVVQSAALPDPKSTAPAGNRPAPVGIRPTPVPAPTSPAGVSNSMSSVIAQAVLNMLNNERGANHLPGLRMNGQLISSAHAHNLMMARYNTMSHQLPGEAYFGDRILAAGYNYQYAGENVGWNSQMTEQGALDLESIMYNETPPNDGHRQNILSPNFVDVGIDIYFDSVNQKLWLTEDFGKSF